MLSLLNQTPFAAQLFSSSNNTITCVIKMGFKFDQFGDLLLLSEQPEIQLANVIPEKPYAELIVYGKGSELVEYKKLSEYFEEGDWLELKDIFEQNSQTEIYLPPDHLSLLYQDGWEEKSLVKVCDTLTVNQESKEIHLLFRSNLTWDSDAGRRGYLVLKEEGRKYESESGTIAS